MPTAKRRINLAVPEDLEAKLEIVAKAERRPLAGLCVHLIEQALEMPRFRQLLHIAPRSDRKVIKETEIDQLSPERLSELQTLLSALQKFKV